MLLKCATTQTRSHLTLKKKITLLAEGGSLLGPQRLPKLLLVRNTLLWLEIQFPVGRVITKPIEHIFLLPFLLENLLCPLRDPRAKSIALVLYTLYICGGAS